MKYVIQVLITVVLIASYHEFENAKMRFDGQSSNVISVREPDIQTLTISQPRIASIVEYAILRDIPWDNNQLHRYAVQMNKAISEDVKSGLFHDMVLPSKMFEIGSEVFFRDDWIVDVQEENKDLVAKFPKGGLLVMHLEKIVYPQCKTDEEPMLLFLALTKKGAILKQQVEYRAERGGWRVIIGGEDDYDPEKLNYRALIKRGCRKKQDK